MAQITRTGIIPKTANEYIAEIQEQWRTIFGSSLNLEPDTPQGQITALLGLLASMFDQSIVDIGRSLDISQAQGQQLEDLTSILAIYRDGPIKSTCNATLYGNQTAIVPAGSQAKTTNGDIFELVEDVEFVTESASGVFRAIEFGPIPIDAGTLTQISTPVSGWDAVTNTDGTRGRDAETDPQLKRRYFNQLAIGANGTLESIISGIESLEDVEAVSGRENQESTFEMVGDLYMTPHSVAIAVDGGDRDDVAAMIRRRKGFGCSTISERFKFRMKNINHDNSNSGEDPIDYAENFQFELAGCVFQAIISAGTIAFGAELDVEAKMITPEVDAPISIATNMYGTVDDDVPANNKWATLHPIRNETIEVVIVPVYSITNPLELIQEIPIWFRRVSKIPVTVEIELEKGINFPADGEDRIKDYVVAFINGTDQFTDRFELDGLQIGETLYASQLYTPVNMVRGHNITSLTVNGGSSVVTSFDQQVTIDRDDVVISNA